jgi:hypothetical protein
MSTDDLAAFLAARLDEDAEIVETIRSGGFPAATWTTEPAKGGWEILRESDDPTPLGYVTRSRCEHVHIARHDPARVLREVEAKRALLVLADPASGDGLDYGGEWILAAMALAYSDHPDYRAEWKP